jgi:hypothetical protein
VRTRIVLGLVLLFTFILPQTAWAASDNIILFGRSATLPANETVDNVVVWGGSARIAGSVRGSVVVIGGSITFEDGATVDGEVVCLGGSIERLGEVRIRGEEIAIGSLGGWNLNLGWLGGWLRFSWSAWKALGTIVLGLIVYALFPQALQRIKGAISTAPDRSVLFGLLGFVGLVPLCILLAITLVGILLIPVVTLGVAVGVLLGQVAFGYFLGERLAERLQWQLSEPLFPVVGLLLISLVAAFPVVGGLIRLLVGLIALGAAILTRFGTRPLEIEVKP